MRYRGFSPLLQMTPKALDCCEHRSFPGAGRVVSNYQELWFPQQSRAFGVIEGAVVSSPRLNTTES
jgi:hypothetical protein